MKNVNIEAWASEQLEKEVGYLAENLQAENHRLGVIKQLNAHRKNEIDRDRLNLKREELGLMSVAEGQKEE